MAKFMTVVLFLLVVVLAAIGGVLYQYNPEPVEVELILGYGLTARLIELLGGALGVGVLFGWIVAWTRNLCRARKASAAEKTEASTLDELLDAPTAPSDSV